MLYRLAAALLALLCLPAAAHAACTVGMPPPFSTATRMDTQTSDNVSITGGCIDGTPIGENNPSTGHFTNIIVSDAVDANTNPAINIKKKYGQAPRGAICDGASHPLSGYYSDLASAQSHYPSATSLTNELDGVAINNAFDQARVVLATNGDGVLVEFPQGKCIVNTSINATRLRGNAIEVRGYGNMIVTSAKGLVAFDSLGSSRVKFTNMVIQSLDPATAPRVGWQWGRGKYATFESAASYTMIMPIVSGFYEQTACLNFATEITTMIHPLCSNRMTLGIGTADISGTTLTVTAADAGKEFFAVGRELKATGIKPGTYITALGTGTGGNGTYTVNYSQTVASTRFVARSYAYQADALNHWKAKSSYIGDDLDSIAADTMPQSTLADFSYGGEFLSGLPTGDVASTDHAPAIWISRTHGTKFIGGYVLAYGDHAVTIFMGAFSSPLDTGWFNEIRNLEFDLVHVETRAAAVFYIDGINDKVKLQGFRYTDETVFPLDKLFTVSPQISAVYLDGAEIKITSTIGGDDFRFFDNPDKYAVSGEFMVPYIENWNKPAQFLGGKVCFASPLSAPRPLCKGTPIVLFSESHGPGVWDNTNNGTTENNLLMLRLPWMDAGDELELSTTWDSIRSSPTTNTQYAIIKWASGSFDDCTLGQPCGTSGDGHPGNALLFRPFASPTTLAGISTDQVSGSYITTMRISSDDPTYKIVSEVRNTGVGDRPANISLIQGGDPRVGANLQFNCQNFTNAADTCGLRSVRATYFSPAGQNKKMPF